MSPSTMTRTRRYYLNHLEGGRRGLIAPDRSLIQRLDALELANDIRSRRAQLKRDLRAGRAEFLDLLAAPPWWLESAKVYEILLCVPKVGRVKANQAINRTRVSPSKTFGGLSERQRREILALLPRMNPWKAGRLEAAR